MEQWNCLPQELEYLSRRDPLLGDAIRRIGLPQRQLVPGLFPGLVFSVINQQISMKAAETIWKRFGSRFGEITPQNLAAATPQEIQALGITMRKAQNLHDIAGRIVRGELDLDRLAQLDDYALCKELSSLPGIGVWTAEMLMIFCMGRPDIVSYGDLAILRGMRMLYGRKVIDRAAFDRYCRRYSPYGTTASLYLWAIACGALPELRDPAVPKQKGAKKAP